MSEVNSYYYFRRVDAFYSQINFALGFGCISSCPTNSVLRYCSPGVIYNGQILSFRASCEYTFLKFCTQHKVTWLYYFAQCSKPYACVILRNAQNHMLVLFCAMREMT